MDVYAAREDPVPGVSGALVADAVPLPAERVAFVPSWSRGGGRGAGAGAPGDLVLTLGAGDVTMIGPEVLALLGGSDRDEPPGRRRCASRHRDDRAVRGPRPAAARSRARRPALVAAAVRRGAGRAGCPGLLRPGCWRSRSVRVSGVGGPTADPAVAAARSTRGPPLPGSSRLPRSTGCRRGGRRPGRREPGRRTSTRRSCRAVRLVAVAPQRRRLRRSTPRRRPSPTAARPTLVRCRDLGVAVGVDARTRSPRHGRARRAAAEPAQPGQPGERRLPGRRPDEAGVGHRGAGASADDSEPRPGCRPR